MKTQLPALLLLAVACALPAGAQAQDAAGAIVQDYDPEPAIWRVRDEDTTIYLLGTIHVLPEGFRWRSPRLDAIIADADELIVESTDADAEGALDGLTEQLAKFAKRPPMSARLSPASAEKWLALGESAGIPPEVFDRMPPVLAMLGMGLSQSMETTGSEAQFGVETVLEAEFGAAGKPIGSIESAADVLASLLAIDEAVLIKELDRELGRLDGKAFAAALAASPKAAATGGKNAPLAEEHAWAQGQEMDVRDELFGETSFTQSLGKRLLDGRNRAWAAWFERRLAEPGTVLVAVGAGHLAGRNSLHEMLAKRGLASERLNRPQ